MKKTLGHGGQSAYDQLRGIVTQVGAENNKAVIDGTQEITQKINALTKIVDDVTMNMRMTQTSIAEIKKMMRVSNDFDKLRGISMSMAITLLLASIFFATMPLKGALTLCVATSALCIVVAFFRRT